MPQYKERRPGYNGILYGSCDACWYISEPWIDRYNGERVFIKPTIAIEGTDALNRGSSGNAQYQRFHHVLGAIKNGVIGIYYLKKGRSEIRPDLFGMAYFASKAERTPYLVIDNLEIVKILLELQNSSYELNRYINEYMNYMYNKFLAYFKKNYKNDWDQFAKKRSTIIKDNYVVKLSARMKRNFTDSSQRAGHIALGEMYLSKYFFIDKKIYYLFLRMTRSDLLYLDKHKSRDKEWHLLRHESNVEIKTIDDIVGLDSNIRDKLMAIKDKPLNGGETNILYNECIEKIMQGIQSGDLIIRIN